MKLNNWYYIKLSSGVEYLLYPRTKMDDTIISLVFVYGNNDLRIDIISHYRENDYDVMLSPNYASTGAKEYVIKKLFETANDGIINFN